MNGWTNMGAHAGHSEVPRREVLNRIEQFHKSISPRLPLLLSFFLSFSCSCAANDYTSPRGGYTCAHRFAFMSVRVNTHPAESPLTGRRHVSSNSIQIVSLKGSTLPTGPLGALDTEMAHTRTHTHRHTHAQATPPWPLDACRNSPVTCIVY